MNNDLYNIIVVTIAAISVLGSALTILWISVLKPTQNWFAECEELENRIRTIDNVTEQHRELLKLKKQSWHRITGGRIRELALMMEVKYNVQILR